MIGVSAPCRGPAPLERGPVGLTSLRCVGLTAGWYYSPSLAIPAISLRATSPAPMSSRIMK